MPLQAHKKVEITQKRRFKVNDAVVLRLPKFVKDADDNTVYPQEVLKEFIKYFNQLYQAKAVFAERYIVDGKDKSHLDLFVYVPGELTREDFLDDLADFIEDYPTVKAEIIKRWPKANEWNEAHKAEIASGVVKPRQEGIKMAKNSTSAYPKRTFKTLLSWVMEEEPVHPYPNATTEELEALERKRDPKLMEFYKKDDEYESHQDEIRGLINTFEQAYGTKFNKNDPDDIEGLELVYNDEYDETIKEQRQWYPADIRLIFNVGQFAPGKEGNIDLLSLYDKKVKGKDSIKDDEDPKLTICKLLGEAHDKIMIALDLVKDLENENELSSSLKADLEDLADSVSEFDFMDKSNPVGVLMDIYPIEVDYSDDDEDEELENEDIYR